jgi:uncharacterized protein DUF6527
VTTEIDLGSGYWFSWVSWKPDRALNPQFEGIPDVERYGIIIRCPHGEGAVVFDSEVARKIDRDHPRWIVESWEPLTIAPSIQRRRAPDGTGCECHGFIRGGRWISL